MTENLLLCTTKSNFQANASQMVNGKKSIARGAKWEHASSKSARFFLKLNVLYMPRIAEFHQCVNNFGNKADVMRSVKCNKRNDIAGQTIETDWHVCPGDTSVQMLHKVQEFMSETGHASESFPDRITYASMFNDITDCTNKCLDSEGSDLSCSKTQSW